MISAVMQKIKLTAILTVAILITSVVVVTSLSTVGTSQNVSAEPNNSSVQINRDRDRLEVRVTDPNGVRSVSVLFPDGSSDDRTFGCETEVFSRITVGLLPPGFSFVVVVDDCQEPSSRDMHTCTIGEGCTLELPPPPPDVHDSILEEVQKIEEKLDGTRPSLITQISNAITNTILPALTSIQNTLSSIQNSIAQILGILQDPEFGLGEIKREVSSIEQKLDSLKIPIKVDIGVARLNDHRFAILTTELGEQVDTDVVMVKAVKVKGGDDDKNGIKIESKVLTASEFKVTKVQTGLFVLEVLDKARSAADVIELKVQHTHDGTVHLGAIIFDKGVKENTNQ